VLLASLYDWSIGETSAREEKKREKKQKTSSAKDLLDHHHTGILSSVWLCSFPDLDTLQITHLRKVYGIM
jgi:hypothetical protein